MASFGGGGGGDGDDFSFPVTFELKREDEKQKKEELQREVSMLEKRLINEQKVHEILQHVLDPKDDTPLSIPHYLPPQTRELLSELVTVEEEIARLETQIQTLQTQVKNERSDTKTNQPKPKITRPSNEKEKGNNGFETKALHFISKAINGDYYAINNVCVDNKKAESLKENGNNNNEKLQLKRSGLLKNNYAAASPLRDNFRHPTPYKPRERSGEILGELPWKSPSNPIHRTESSQKWNPNKLSESITKCLILIYVRLIRASRQMELERCGPLSRSTFSSLSFRSSDSPSSTTALNPSTSLILLQNKDSKQRDPFGIFDIDEAIPRDIGPYKNFVVLTSSSLDPKCVSGSSSLPLFQKLRGLFASLQKVDLRPLSEQQKLAFWINIYNSCLLHGFLQYGVPSTPEKLLTLMNKATLNVAGSIVNAQAIERCILREPPPFLFKEGNKESKEAIIHDLYGLHSLNPNVIFALSCGTRSSPAVRIFKADGVLSELEKAKLEYLQASILVTQTKRIGLPELLVRNMLDFAKDMDSLVTWVCHQLPTSGSLRKSLVDCLKTSHPGTRVSSINVETLPYDFEFRYLLQV